MSDPEAAQNQLSSGVTPETLDAALREKLGAVHVDIADLSGTTTTSRRRRGIHRDRGPPAQNS
jgi:hypothetical protein